MLILFGCKSEPNVILKKPIPLKELSLNGTFYNGMVLEKKLYKIFENSDVDSLYKKQVFDNIEYNPKKYSKDIDIYGSTQTPDNFLFCDLNHDNIEDLVFQSNGPFITDSHKFIIFLSSLKKYSATEVAGQISAITETEEYCCRTYMAKKEKYLKINYFYHGCCDDPWDDYFIAILNLNGGRFQNIESHSINTTKEKVEKKINEKK